MEIRPRSTSQNYRQQKFEHRLVHHPQQSASPHRAIYLKDDENVDPSQDDSSDGHLRLHGDVERLVGHGQRHHLIIAQEGLDRDDDGVTARGKGNGDDADASPFITHNLYY